MITLHHHSDTGEKIYSISVHHSHDEGMIIETIPHHTPKPREEGGLERELDALLTGFLFLMGLMLLYILRRLRRAEKCLAVIQHKLSSIGQKSELLLPEEVALPDQAPAATPALAGRLDAWSGVISCWGVPTMLAAHDARDAWQQWCSKWEWKYRVGKKVSSMPQDVAWYASLGIPFPEIGIEEAPSASGAAAPPPATVAALAEKLRQVSRNKVEIARRFSIWAKTQRATRGVLLTPDPHEVFWFIGDVHGSLSALVQILTFIEGRKSPGQRHTLVFLGDLLDRGEDSWGVAAIVQLLLLEETPDLRVLMIKGNHDAGFYVKLNGVFASKVSPADAVDELNNMQDKEAAAILAEAFCELVRISPCMGEIICPCTDAPPGATILLCHGGLPHLDLQEEMFSGILYAQTQPLQSPPWLDKSFMPALEECGGEDLVSRVEKDFEWIRLSDKSAHTRIHRGAATSGCTMGFNDVNMYRRLHYLLTGRAITFILRGHEHEAKGYAVYHYHSLYNPRTNVNQVQTSCGVLTINSFSASQSAADPRKPCVACWAAAQDRIVVYPLFSNQ